MNDPSIEKLRSVLPHSAIDDVTDLMRQARDSEWTEADLRRRAQLLVAEWQAADSQFTKAWYRTRDEASSMQAEAGRVTRALGEVLGDQAQQGALHAGSLAERAAAQIGHLRGLVEDLKSELTNAQNVGFEEGDRAREMQSRLTMMRFDLSESRARAHQLSLAQEEARRQELRAQRDLELAQAQVERYGNLTDTMSLGTSQLAAQYAELTDAVGMDPDGQTSPREAVQALLTRSLNEAVARAQSAIAGSGRSVDSAWREGARWALRATGVRATPPPPEDPEPLDKSS